MRNIILSILGVLILIGSFFIAKKIIANKHKPKPVTSKIVKTVFVDTVKNSTVPVVITANGNLKAKQRLELYSEVQGIFLKGSHLFKPGQTYKQGQALIRVDASEFYASVQAAKSNLYNSIAAIMPDLRLDFPEVFNKWQAYLTSFDLNKTTPSLPKMTTEKENYFITGRGIVSSYYNVKNLEKRLSKYVMYAPFNGILTEALVTEGTLIRNGQKLGEFINPSVYEMEISVSKSFVNILKVGAPVSLTNLEKTDTLVGKLSRVNGRIDPTTQSVTAFVEVADKSLKEGMYLEANLSAKNIDDAIEIDRTLLTDNQEIFVVKDSILDLVPAKPIYFSDTKVVLKGIPNGTVILKRPVPGAYSGMLVTPFIEKNKPEDTL